MLEIWLETSNNIFWKKKYFVKIYEFSLLKLKKYKNRKIDAFMLLAISLAIFELQRRIISHFNPHNNSFWPYEKQFYCRVNRFWVIRPNVITIFFYPHFTCTWRWTLKHAHWPIKEVILRRTLVHANDGGH